MDTHDCGIDCKLITYPSGRVVHEMYPYTPNAVAGRYQWEQNQGMTRRQYRASGQDETRAVRVWDAMRAASPRKRVARNVPA